MFKEMSKAYRDAIEEMNAEGKKGDAKARHAAKANQEAFRQFGIEQARKFRKASSSPRQAWSQACQAWRASSSSGDPAGLPASSEDSAGQPGLGGH